MAKAEKKAKNTQIQFSSDQSQSDPKREKFLRLSENRTEAVREKLRLLGNLSKSRFYTFSSRDVKEMFETIDKEVNGAKARFESALKSTPKGKKK